MERSHNKIPEEVEAKNTLPMWATPPWPEWNDSEISTEIWEIDTEESSEEQQLFVDPTGELLPPSIKPTKWIRPDSLEDPPKLIEWNNAPKIDLINPNMHLCQEVDLIRFILSEISELYDYGAQNTFQLEGEGTCFVPNSSSRSAFWRPFDNIYSDCKSGIKNDRPTLNRIGKYYVRLYYMGSWRRITVDDRIPVLKDGMLGLPITSLNEIWPAILVKALLKIASLTWEYDTGVGIGKVQRFSTIAALTGWVHEWVDIPEPISSTDLWDQLGNILPKYDGKVATKINYWTTGKTKKQRMVEEGDPVAEKVVNSDDAMNWWTLVQNEEDIIDTEYLDCSDSEMLTAAATSLPNDSDFLETSAAQSVFSVSEMEAADEAEEWELEEMQKRQEDNGGSRKSKLNKEKKRGGNDANISEMEASEGQPLNEEEAADEVETEKRPSKSTKVKKKTLKKSTKSRQISSINIEGIENADSKQNVKKNKKGKKDQDLRKKPSTRNLKSPSDDEEEDIEDALAEEEEENEIVGSENKRLSFMTGNGTLETDRLQKPKTPKMRDILLGVKKYLATENYPLISKWESKCGSCVPDVINVILMIYPRPESGPMVPSFLYHPINVVEIRDIPLKKGPNRPTTPLWKTFRWKKWAMKKGIIPMELPLDKIRSIKVTTPFGLKRDWNRARNGTNRIKFLSSGGENEEEFGEYFGEEICGGGGEGSEFGDREEGSFQGEFTTQTSSPNGDLTKEKKNSQRKISEEKEKSKQEIKGSKDIKAPSLNARKMSRASTFMILDKNSSNMLEYAASNSSHHKLKNRKSIKKGKGKEILNSLTNYANDEEETMIDEEEISPANNASGPSQTDVIPPFATSSVWFHCDSVAPYIRKMCKFYSSRPIFGSCFVLHRTASHDFNDAGNVPIIINDDVAVSKTLTLKCQKELVDFHSDQKSFNLTVRFETFKILPISDYNLDNTNNKFTSGFYLFTDCWTEQEIIISLELLQANDIAKFPVTLSNLPESPEKIESNDAFKVGFLIEPWDWTNHESFTKEPVVQCVADKNWTTFLTLHPGRNIFRISIIENPKEQAKTFLDLQETEDKEINSKEEDVIPQENEEKKSKEEDVIPQENEEIKLNIMDVEVVETIPASIFTQYSWKLTSRTPIHVGSRNEVLNYMTNEPVLLLKQCENIAQNIWTMFLFFGKPRAVYTQNFQSLRKSYCPSESDVIKVMGVHSTFEDYFVEMIRDMNNGKLEPKMLLALKCLFLNPLLGQNLPQMDKEPPTVELTLPILTPDATVVVNAQDMKEETVEEFSTTKVIAVLTIQRFCRGWLVRRLFQIRTKGSSKFLKMEYQVRKIAYILACHTTSEFSSGMENKTDDQLEVTDKINSQKPPSINLITESNEEEYENNLGSEEEEHEQLLQPNVTPEMLHNTTEVSNDAFTNMPSLVPNPPKWTVKLLKRLFDKYPLLVTKHPHASSVSNHVKIREIEGTIPNVLNDKNCTPFYRRIVTLVGEQTSCCCIIQLEVIPKTPVMMKIINNDDHSHPIETQTDHYFVGNLMANKTGYTIICYRLIPKNDESGENHLDDIPLFHYWKVRIVTSKTLDCLVFKDEVHHIHHHHRHHNQEEGTDQSDLHHINQEVPIIQTSSNPSHEHKTVINVTNEIPDLTNGKVE